MKEEQTVSSLQDIPVHNVLRAFSRVVYVLIWLGEKGGRRPKANNLGVDLLGSGPGKIRSNVKFKV